MKQNKMRPLVAPTTIRTWANKEGIPVGARGRLPEEIVDRYLEHKGRKRWVAGSKKTNRTPA